MAIGQDIGMGTSYGGGITGLNTGVNLAATGLQTSNAPRPRMQGTPNLNQLYQTAMDAFRKTAILHLLLAMQNLQSMPRKAAY